MKDILQKFCADKPRIHAPWSRDGYTYATNGHVVIRVPEVDGISQSQEAPSLKPVLKYFDIDPDIWYPLKKVKMPKPDVCGSCNGRGRDVACPECEGIGIVSWDGTYHTYKDTCKLCEGRGAVEICPECYGEEKTPSQIPVKIGGVWFYPPTLAPCLEFLPNCAIGIIGGMEDPQRLRFDGGDGLIMPCRHGG